MREAGVSKLASVSESRQYKDKKGKTWFTFTCLFEDGFRLHTRREEDHIEIVVGDNIHYIIRLDTSFGPHGTTEKVPDNAVMQQPEERKVNVDEVKDLIQGLYEILDYRLSEISESIKVIKESVDEINDDVAAHALTNSGVEDTLKDLSKAVHFIGQKVHE